MNKDTNKVIAKRVSLADLIKKDHPEPSESEKQYNDFMGQFKPRAEADPTYAEDAYKEADEARLELRRKYNDFVNRASKYLGYKTEADPFYAEDTFKKATADSEALKTKYNDFLKQASEYLEPRSLKPSLYSRLKDYVSSIFEREVSMPAKISLLDIANDEREARKEQNDKISNQRKIGESISDKELMKQLDDLKEEMSMFCYSLDSNFSEDDRADYEYLSIFVEEADSYKELYTGLVEKIKLATGKTIDSKPLDEMIQYSSEVFDKFGMRDDLTSEEIAKWVAEDRRLDPFYELKYDQEELKSEISDFCSYISVEASKLRPAGIVSEVIDSDLAKGTYIVSEQLSEMKEQYKANAKILRSEFGRDKSDDYFYKKIRKAEKILEDVKQTQSSDYKMNPIEAKIESVLNSGLMKIKSVVKTVADYIDDASKAEAEAMRELNLLDQTGYSSFNSLYNDTFF